jgi:ribonuclease HII
LDKFDDSKFKDSKKLSEKKRQEVFKQIRNLENEKKILYAFGFSTAKEIDDF